MESVVQKEDTKLQNYQTWHFTQRFMASNLSAQTWKIGCYMKGSSPARKGDFED